MSACAIFGGTNDVMAGSVIPYYLPCRDDERISSFRHDTRGDQHKRHRLAVHLVSRGLQARRMTYCLT